MTMPRFVKSTNSVMLSTFAVGSNGCSLDEDRGKDGRLDCR